MWKPRWLLALPLALATMAGPAGASSIRDEARLFSRNAERQAEAVLDRIEISSGMTTTIETIDSLEGLSVDTVSLLHARRSGTRGVYVLISKGDKRIEVRTSGKFAHLLPDPRAREVRNAFARGFLKNDFDAGLVQGVQALEREVSAARAAGGGPIQGGRPGGAVNKPFGLGSLVGIALAVLAILFVVRLFGGLMGAGARGYPGSGRMGAPGYGAPGYGGGGGGGGFWSSMMGGIGGAVAGNWLYDQFSGRHHSGGGYADNASQGDYGQQATGGDDWANGSSASGDWGGGDAGGGGDWGGGAGGDWGGGGGDWGGGGGGDGGGGW